MNDLQIEYFLSAAQNLSYTKTANERFVSQPAVSKQISSLEAELEIKLFEVGYKSLKLTPAGRMYYEYFTKHYEELSRMKELLKSNLRREEYTIRVGCGSGWTLKDVLPQVVEELKAQYGNVRVILENCAFSEISYSLVEDDFDIGITLENDVLVLPTLEIVKLIEIPRMIIYSPKLQFSKMDNLTPTDFKGEYFFVPRIQKFSYASDLVRSYCEPYGFKPEICEVRNTESLLNAVINGLGVAVVDYWTYITVQDVCNAVQLDSNDGISVLWKKNNNNSLVDNFVEVLKKHI